MTTNKHQAFCRMRSLLYRWKSFAYDLSRTAIKVVIALFGASIFAVTGTYLFTSNHTLVSLICGGVERVSALQISYGQDASISRSLVPTIRLNDLSIQDEENSFLFKTSSLVVQINPFSMVFGDLNLPQLILGETSVKIRQDKTESQFVLPEDPWLRPILGNVQIGHLDVIHGDQQFTLPFFQINKLTLLADPEADILKITTKKKIADHLITFQAEIPRVRRIMAEKMMPFSLVAHGAVEEVEIVGEINLGSSGPTIQAKITAQADDLQSFFRTVSQPIPEGSLRVQAILQGDFSRIKMSDIKSSCTLSGDSIFHIKGHIDDLLGMDEIELSLTGELSEVSWLSPYLPNSFGTLKNAALSGHLAGSAQKMFIRDASVKVITEDGLDVTIAGNFNLNNSEDGLVPEDMALHLDFAAPSTRAARALIFDNVWELGAIQGSADIITKTGTPALEKIVIRTEDPQGIKVLLSGRINKFPLNPQESNSGYDLTVKMTSLQTSVMAKRFALELPNIGPLAIEYRIEGDTQALELNEITTKSGSAKAALFTSQGFVHFTNWSLPDPVDEAKLDVNFDFADTASLASLLEVHLPELGGLHGGVKIFKESDHYLMDAISLQTDPNSPVALNLSGSLPVKISQEISFAEAHISLQATVLDNGWLNKQFGLSPPLIPSLEKWQLTASFSGNGQRVVVDDLTLVAGDENSLLVSAKGSEIILTETDRWLPQSCNIAMVGQAKSSQKVSEMFGYKLPELGVFSAHTFLNGANGQFSLDSISITAGDPKRAALRVQGDIAKLFSVKRAINLEGMVNLDGHTFAAFAYDRSRTAADKMKLPDLGPLKGSILLSNRDGSLGIDKISLISEQADIFSIHLLGSFDDFSQPDSADINLTLESRDLQVLGAIIDKEWPKVGPVSLSTKLAIIHMGEELNANIQIGSMEIEAIVTADFQKKIPLLTGSISAKEVFWPQFTADSSQKKGPKKIESGAFFSSKPIPFEWLKKIDADISINIDSFNKKSLAIDSAQLDILLKAGHLIIAPAKLIYPKGVIDFAITVDNQGSPQITIKVDGSNINPWLALDMTTSASARLFAARLDINSQLSSSGNTAKQLAANLKGDLYLTLKNGKIRKKIIDLVFIDLIGWTTSTIRNDAYVDVDCGVADYSIQQGVINTNGLFLSTKNVDIAGEGIIDLDREKLDYVILPKKKTKMLSSVDPVRIQGSIRNPTVKVIPWKSAVTTYGGMFVAPPLMFGMIAADFLFAKAVGSARTSPCLEYMKAKR